MRLGKSSKALKPAKIQDVARRAGVSISTVSNALNGRTARMSAPTLARVEQAIDELQFRPNRAARQLKTGHTPLLGLLVPSIANPAFGVLAREVEIAANEIHGYRVLLGNTYRSQQNEKEFFDDLLAHGVRGVIVCSSLQDQHHLDDATRRGLAVVSYDRRAARGQPLTVDHVSMHNRRAGEIATQYLIDNGHVHVAFATPSGRTVSRADKIAGFRAATRRAGLARTATVLECEPRLTPQAAYGDAELAELGRTLANDLASRVDRPSAIVAVNDLMAIGLIAGFRDRGIRVPEGVSVVGIDDLYLSSLFRPALTTVRPPIAAMAHKMVELVIARLSDPSIAKAEFLFEPTLVVRETVCSIERGRDDAGPTRRVRPGNAD